MQYKKMQKYKDLIKDFIQPLLPAKPYCSDGNACPTVIRSQKHAIRYPQIQINSPFSWKIMVFDVDHQNAAFVWEDVGLAAPNLIVQNPDNGHCHLFYVLKTPVATYDTAKMKPIRYAKAIYHAMAVKLGADLRYAGLLAHNPLHEQWQTSLLHTNTFTLDELAMDFELPNMFELEKRQKHQDILESGQLFGRNCAVFDCLRFWAYDAVRQYRGSEFKKWHTAVFNKALGFNDFAIPLSVNKIGHIAKSVAKWVWKHDGECEQRFIERQSNKGKKSGVVRRAVIEPLKQKAFLLWQKGKHTQEQIAQQLNKSQETISRWLKEMKSMQVSPSKRSWLDVLRGALMKKRAQQQKQNQEHSHSGCLKTDTQTEVTHTQIKSNPKPKYVPIALITLAHFYFYWFMHEPKSDLNPVGWA